MRRRRGVLRAVGGRGRREASRRSRGERAAACAAHHKPTARGARPDVAVDPLRPQGAVGLRRHGLLLDPLERQLLVSHHRGHRFGGPHLSREPHDRLRAARQHDRRRPLHLRPHVAARGEGPREHGRRRVGRGYRGRSILCSGALLHGRDILASIHPAGRQPTLCHLHRHAVGGGRHAGQVRDGPAREGNLRDGVPAIAGRAARAGGLRDQQHGHRGERGRDGYQLLQRQAGAQSGRGGQTFVEQHELQGQPIQYRPRHGLLPLNPRPS